MKIRSPSCVAIYGYKMVSNAVQSLQKELGIVQILHEGSHYKGNRDKAVINYGSTTIPPNVMKSWIINKPSSVQLCVNKRNFFSHLFEIESPVSTPDWTVEPDVAKKWLANNEVLLARKSLTGHSGAGIEILRKGSKFVEAPLYTVYVPKQYEYRVHILDGEVIDIQRKILKKDSGQWMEDVQKKIRSHSNGWIFTRDPALLNIPCEKITEQAKMAVQCMDLDFGSVDLIWSKKKQECYVLEINTAPGLEGASVGIWGAAFRKWLNLKETRK